jgi:phosphoglycolate phosphatase-like HAD superfamily hydrolase
MRKIYAFDFDGVITSNSNELLQIYRYVWDKMGKKDNITREDVENFRPYVKHAVDNYAVMLLFYEKTELIDKRIKATLKRHAKDARKFSELFMEARKEIRRKSFKKWTELYDPHWFAIDVIKKLARNNTVYIVSTKDTNTIIVLLKHLGITIPKENILGGHLSFDKNDHIDFIAEKEHVEIGDIIFIDDNLEHLKPIKKKGVKVVMASWGYTTPKKIKEAEKLGIPIATEKTLKEILELPR